MVYGLGTFLGVHYGTGKELDENLKNLLEHFLEKHECLPVQGKIIKKIAPCRKFFFDCVMV